MVSVHHRTRQDREEAWSVVLAYMRRWQIEQTWRYDKSELAVQSPRVWQRQEREKLLLMATWPMLFLHSCWSRLSAVRRWLLRYDYHRTGASSDGYGSALSLAQCALPVYLGLEYRPDSAR